jgi:hypothetical protein
MYVKGEVEKISTPTENSENLFLVHSLINYIDCELQLFKAYEPERDQQKETTHESKSKSDECVEEMEEHSWSNDLSHKKSPVFHGGKIINNKKIV